MVDSFDEELYCSLKDELRKVEAQIVTYTEMSKFLPAYLFSQIPSPPSLFLCIADE